MTSASDIRGRMLAALDFRSIVEMLSDAVVAAGDDNRILYANEAAELLLGWSADELLGQPLTVIIPERLRESHLGGFMRYLHTRDPVLIGHAVRVPALRRDDTEVSVELTLSSVETDDGTLLFVGSLRDVRGLVALERVTEVNRRLLSVLADASPLGASAPQVLASLAETLGWDVAALWVPDEESRVLRCRDLWHRADVDIPRFERATLATSLRHGEGLPGRVWAEGAPAWLADVTQDANFPRVRAARADGLQGGAAFPVATGERVMGVIELFSRAFREPDPEVVKTMASVATPLGQFIERRNVQEALESSRGRLDLALQAARMGVWEWDIATGTVRSSESTERILGFPPGTFPGTYDAYQQRLHPEDRPKNEQAIADALAGGRDYHDEHRIVLPDGGTRWVEGRGRVLRNALGEVAGMTGVVLDISARKEAEAEKEGLQRDRLRAADVLQRALLPPHLPDIPGVGLASRYRAVGYGEVGGDFYDLFPLRGKSWGVAIGDVQGKGPEAAAITAMVHYTLRASAMRARGPHRALQQVNAAMLLGANDEDSRFCTLLFARLLPQSSGVQLVVANGGHPQPLILRRDGTVESVEQPGMIVGAFPDAEFTSQRAHLAPGDAALFYTDGIIEARTGEGLFGEERLRDLLATGTGLSAEEIAGCVFDSVLKVDPEPRDDLCVLVVRASEPADD